MGNAEPIGDSTPPPPSRFKFVSQLLSRTHGALMRFVMRILAIGPIPTHIAIIMDGNRRFADRLGMKRHQGHIFGYYQLIKTLECCWELGVKCVTVYAFSIDNFSRSGEEVNTLMDLLADKLNELMTKDTLLNDHGVRVQLLGDLELLPENVQVAARRAMAATKNNTAVVLNLCVPYTSTAEIVHSIERTRDDVLMACREGGVVDGNGALSSRAIEGLCGGDCARSSSSFSGFNSRDSEVGVGGAADGNGALNSRAHEQLCGGDCSESSSSFIGSDSKESEVGVGGIANGNGALDNRADGQLCGGDCARSSSSSSDSNSRELEVGVGGGGRRSRASYICDDQTGSGRPSSSEIRGKHNADASVLQAVDVGADEGNLSSDDQESDSRNEILVREKEVEKVDGSNGALHDGEVPGIAEDSGGQRDGGARTDMGSRADLAALLDSVTSETLESRLYTAGCPTPDILLRTSGETRLSNFMLWQCCSSSRLVFCKVLWPEFNFRHISLIILEYQRAYFRQCTGIRSGNGELLMA